MSAAWLIFLLPPVATAEKKTAREDGRFLIYVAGKEIGKEQFSILGSADSASSSSVLELRDPASNKNVQIETQLTMSSRYLPQTYKINSNVGGQKGAVLGAFSPGQAMFEYQGEGSSRKNGILVGNQFTVLDTNIFHHFTFIARLLNLDGKDKVQAFEVVVPQELETGFLKITQAGREKVDLRGKNKELYHLKADSGFLVIHFWIDDQRVLYKIALPDKGIEVIRN
jgi:hypothetical protein